MKHSYDVPSQSPLTRPELYYMNNTGTLIPTKHFEKLFEI